MKSTKTIKIGILGLGRGKAFFESLMYCNAEIVAICDRDDSRRNAIWEMLGKSPTPYTNFDEFIEHKGLDAVVVSNCFHQHAPYAIRCLEKNIHVLSECTSNGTMAEGVALVRASEKSKAIYMLAENYPYRRFNREITRVCEEGTLGKILYAEGEYNHPVAPDDLNFYKTYRFYVDHWRHYCPATYYITHSLAPIMQATRAIPIRVTAMPVFAPFTDEPLNVSRGADRAAIITCLNNDDSVFRITGCAQFGAHENSYRVCGINGQVESLRGMGEHVMLQYNAWSVPEGKKQINLYEPAWDDPDAEIIKKQGHGGGDFYIVREFLNAVRSGKPHMFDVHFATTMASVGILAHRSMMEGGTPYDIPDFHKEEDRKKYENDYLTPFLGDNGEAPTLPCCSHPDYLPTPEQYAKYKEVMGEYNPMLHEKDI
jgi:predicted dehydrogenase